MKRAILGFHRDGAGDWVADLDCGHGQHMRHRPPFVSRPWVESEATRTHMLGVELDCPRCNRMDWPEDFVAYRRTREFDETTVPKGLLREHTTRSGVWARIHVVSGALKYHVGPPIDRHLVVDAAEAGIIVPEVPHRLEATGRVRFSVEFWRARSIVATSCL